MKVSVNYRYILILLATILVAFAGCSSTPTPNDEASKKAVSSTDEQIFVGDSVEMSYDPNVIMKRAESFFDKESYAEAIVEYKHFLDLHRNHILAPYAQYKIGVSHFKQYRTVDRDPEPLNHAIQGFEKLLQDFPASRHETEAKQTILICKEQLAQRHLMVGQFYLRREAYLAAAHRFEKVIKEFPELESAGDAMFHLAKTYQDLGVEEWTQEWLLALVKEHPNNPYHSDGKKLLAKLQKNNPTLLASLPRNTSLNGQPPTNPSLNGQPPTNPSLNGHTHPNPSQNGQNPAKKVPVGLLPKDFPIISSNGIHPIPPKPVRMTFSTPAESNSYQTACTIGTWCDSQSASRTTPFPQLSKNPKSCKTGEWC